ncbi:AbrB/MazE/SpoVT family DNA-binding domain-containing protein [Thermosulfurimonas sp.]|uniref:AbrB/MazE/SpoVT family DNA-binding domain-containing protein n=1 Tax=Thermosulfurimonas sp. TaxID=2080236 RepID=UPI00342D39F5
MIVTVSSKGQVVIPAEIRKKFNLRRGKRLAVFVEDERIILKPVEELLRRGRGLLPQKGKALKILLEERRKEEQGEKVCF